MKINHDFIKKIFNLKLKLKNKSDKIKLSNYEEFIPMYDIYSQTIYPINKLNLHYRLIESHYRFINSEIYLWLQKLYNKNKDNEVATKYKYNIDVMNNYDIDTLIETSYKALYKYSPSLGLLVSICKRHSFDPFIQHLKPYYTKMELIKLGQNMNLIKNDLDPEKLMDREIHHNICETVSKNDVSFKEIKEHHQHILNYDCISWICFYSFTGSFLFNRYLRSFKVSAIRGTRDVDKVSLNPIFYNGLHQIVKCMEEAPALNNDYELYRFVWDDSYLINLREGDIFQDKGFLSTTRDPFYSPGLNGNFGLILLKIKIPKGKKGIGLFMENFSLFHKEEEFLLPPYAKLKLLSKNENFNYYHTNPQFEKLINRKYELELVDVDYKQFYNDHKKITNTSNNYIDVSTININGNDRIDIIKQFIKMYSGDNNQLFLKTNKNNYIFTYQWFESIEGSPYERFYYNKTKNGILFSIFNENGYPFLNIELGSEMVINFLNKFYFYKEDDYDIKNYLDIITEFGRIFSYKKIKIFHPFRNFKEKNLFSYFQKYNDGIYTYLKDKKKFLDLPFINYEIGYWFLDEFFDKKPDDTINEKLPDNLRDKKLKDIFIETIDNYFYFYPKLTDIIDKNIFKNSFVMYEIYEKLLADGKADNFKPNLNYDKEDDVDEDFKLIFRQPIRRM